MDGVRQWRNYSITSRTADAFLSVTVKAVPGGVVSEYLVRRCTVGTVVALDQPEGAFILSTPAPAKILFVTAGSGITPVMGILRNLASDDTPDIAVAHSSTTAEDVIFGGELRMLANRGRFRLAEIHTRADGRLNVDRLATLVNDMHERHTWACGHTGLLDELEKHWAENDLGDLLRTERFLTQLKPTGAGGTVTFSASGATVETDSVQSLLEAGESAGVLMPSGCRMGICFGCVAPLRRGAVRDLRTGETTTAVDGRDVIVQTCISSAAGDCEIAL